MLADPDAHRGGPGDAATRPHPTQMVGDDARKAAITRTPGSSLSSTSVGDELVEWRAVLTDPHERNPLEIPARDSVAGNGRDVRDNHPASRSSRRDRRERCDRTGRDIHRVPGPGRTRGRPAGDGGGSPGQGIGHDARRTRGSTSSSRSTRSSSPRADATHLHLVASGPHRDVRSPATTVPRINTATKPRNRRDRGSDRRRWRRRGRCRARRCRPRGRTS